MTKEITLVELQKQIEALQGKANEIIKIEKAGVIKEMKEKISLYKLTYLELGFKAPEPVIVYKKPPATTQTQAEGQAPATAPATGTGTGTAPKIPIYRNKGAGNEAETWHGGKGAYPKWIYKNIINTVLDKEKGDDGKVAKEKVIKYLDDNGYKIPEPVVPATEEVKAEATAVATA